ncbi:2-oxo acid dehydrogenase subunit E2 [Candidatus Bathyarchaeota archaeon]|nr:2-oxo acid dehydrogenase subunit E2 [Candidatus Bathyarchaeota archaeon]
MQTVILPRLDEDQKSGMILEWLKGEGAEVEKDEPIAIVMSEKIIMDVSAPVSGKLYKVFAQENVEMPVGQIIAVIAEPSDDPTTVSRFVEEAKRSLAKVEVAAPHKPEEKVLISPLARKLAEQYGIDVTTIKGSGPGGRIVKEDILKAVGELKPEAKAPPRVTTIPLTGIRKIIAERMSSSHLAAPHVTLTMDADASEANKLKETGISYNAILIKAVAKALQNYPIFNSTLEGDQIKQFQDINIGLAVAVEEGLIAPVVHNVEKKTLTEINVAVEDLIKKARENRLSVSEVTGGTFTISNLGMFEVDIFTPIITPGQSAILGIGRIVDKPQVVSGRIEIKPTVTFSLSFDHRVADGAVAARFLQLVKKFFENPHLLSP